MSRCRGRRWACAASRSRRASSTRARPTTSRSSRTAAASPSGSTRPSRRTPPPRSSSLVAARASSTKTIFHRIVPGFVIQGGDPTGTGTGGPGYLTVDTPPASAAYTLGVVAMAKTQQQPAGTAGSQFFVVTVPNAGLPPDYAIIGKVTSGLAGRRADRQARERAAAADAGRRDREGDRQGLLGRSRHDDLRRRPRSRRRDALRLAEAAAAACPTSSSGCGARPSTRS